MTTEAPAFTLDTETPEGLHALRIRLTTLELALEQFGVGPLPPGRITTKTGVYRHYKGDLYAVFAVADRSDNGYEGDPVVAYLSLAPVGNPLKVRSVTEFNEQVVDNTSTDHDDTAKPRFKRVADIDLTPEGNHEHRTAGIGDNARGQAWCWGCVWQTPAGDRDYQEKADAHQRDSQS